MIQIIQERKLSNLIAKNIVKTIICMVITPAFPKNCGDCSFNPLTLLLGWFNPLMTRPICLFTHVMFLIQTADQSLIGVDSQWVDRWAWSIRKAKKTNKQTMSTPVNKEQSSFITIIIFHFKKSIFKYGTQIHPSQRLGVYSHRPSSQINNRFLSI